MMNVLTIDLEDYFQVHAFSDVIKFEDWGNYECRIERNTDRLLEILNSVPSPQHLITHSLHNSLTQRVKASFFILGWIAERYPGLVRRIQKEGHEIACHGYAHKLIYTQSKEEFRQDIRKSKDILENLTGNQVIGYRAPSYSITNKSQWAFEVLVEEGFKYDSSIFPIHHDFYGMVNAPRFPFGISLNEKSNFEFSMLNFKNQLHGTTAALSNVLTHSPNNSISNNSKALIEFPLSTVKLFGQNVPLSGGGYFRLFPYPLIKKGLKRINKVEKKPFIFYVHPWEFYTDQPRIKGAAKLSKFRHYVNLNKTEGRFIRLLTEFNFSSIRDILELNKAFTH
jgi:polysaccharide deacetylase family protein (PEP-CTERM system associated)